MSERSRDLLSPEHYESRQIQET